MPSNYFIRCLPNSSYVSRGLIQHNQFLESKFSRNYWTDKYVCYRECRSLAAQPKELWHIPAHRVQVLVALKIDNDKLHAMLASAAAVLISLQLLVATIHA